MKIVPYMIDIKYDFSAQLSDDKCLPVLFIKEVTPLKFDMVRNYWYTHNYYRHPVKDKVKKQYTNILQVGIKVDEADFEGINALIESVQENETVEVPLQYNEEYNIWYESSRFKRRKDKNGNIRYVFDKNSGVSGIVHSGKAKIIIRRNGEVIQSHPIVFYPSGISLEDYNIMISDLFKIREDLIRDDKTKVLIGTKHKITADKLKEAVKNLESPIQAVSNFPASTLTFQWEKARRGKGEKFRVKSELERILYPGKSQFSVFKGKETSNLIENKIIKQELINLKRHCQFYSSTAPLTQSYEKQKIAGTENLFETSSAGLDRRINKKNIKNISSEDISAHIKDINKEIEAIQDIINNEEKLIKDRLTRLRTDKRNSENAIPISIKCKMQLSETNNKYHLLNDQLTTSISSVWSIPDSSLELIGYDYKLNGQIIYLESPNRFLTIKTNSSILEQHLLLFQALEVAKQERKDSFGPIDIVVNGFVSVNERDIWGADIIGEPTRDGKYRNYFFDLNLITSIKVEGKKIETSSLTNDMKTRYYELLKSKDRKITKLDNQIINLNFDKSTLEKLRQSLKYQEDDILTGKSYDELTETIENWLALPLFQSIDIKEHEHFKPTQLFLHDPYYRSIWKNLQEIHEEIGASLIPQYTAREFGVQKVEQIFEIWILFKMIHLLTLEMGWTLLQKKETVKVIEDILIPQGRDSLKNFKATLKQRDWSIVINYEPIIDLLNSNYLMPDFVLRFYNGKEPRGIVYLDAKHRNYKEQAVENWSKDIKEIAIKKYGNILPAMHEWKHSLLASFIVHSDKDYGLEKDTTGENYHAYYNNTYFKDKIKNECKGEEHMYGSIYLLPSVTYVFKNWFRMLMEYRLDEYYTCWSCGSQTVKSETKYTEKGHEKYHITCQDCNEFWVKNHCKNGHNLIKHPSNYHRQVNNNSNWYTVCPTCGDGDFKYKAE